MDYFYLQKSDNSKVWLSGTTASTRLGLVAEMGYYTFIGDDGEEYNPMDIEACNLLDLKGLSSSLTGLVSCILVWFSFGWAHGIFAFFLTYLITKTIMLSINCKVETFNNSHFKIL